MQNKSNSWGIPYQKKKTTIKNNKKAYIKQVVKERIRNKNQNNIKSYYHSKTTSQAYLTTENK